MALVYTVQIRGLLNMAFIHTVQSETSSKHGNNSYCEKSTKSVMVLNTGRVLNAERFLNMKRGLRK